MKKYGSKYQAHIRHINGDIITVIWDDNKQRFNNEIQKANEDLNKYINSDKQYENDELYLEIV